MKGVVFNIVEEVVVETFGDATWEALLDGAGSDGVFTGLGTYDDQILVRIVDVAAAALDVTAADVLRLVGRHGYHRLADRYPRLTARYTGSRALLMDLDGVIHPQVLALNPGAVVPRFTATLVGDAMHLEYRSDRGLCHLAEGLALGATEAFGEQAGVAQPRCRLEGDDRCIVVVTYDGGPHG